MNCLRSNSVLPAPDAVSEARARYAQERLDYHDHFPHMTTLEIQRILTHEDAKSERRIAVMQKLLVAQQRAPHELWALLLVHGMKDVLEQRRAALSAAQNPRLEKLVQRSFLAAIEAIPLYVRAGSLLTYVLTFSDAVLQHSARRVRGPLIAQKDLRAGKAAVR